MEKIRLDLPPVGVRLYSERPAWSDEIPLFRGISYCDAVREVTSGTELWVERESLTTCQWAPIALGFDAPAEGSSFEQSIKPRAVDTVGIYLARLDEFNPEIEPQVVIVRNMAPTLRSMIELLGKQAAA